MQTGCAHRHLLVIRAAREHSGTCLRLAGLLLQRLLLCTAALARWLSLLPADVAQQHGGAEAEEHGVCRRREEQQCGLMKLHATHVTDQRHAMVSCLCAKRVMQ